MSAQPPVDLLFLWHHHQPDYRSPREGRALLPWVRLHATKDYLDMALHLEGHPGVHATFNFVPSLLDQLEEAVAGGRERLFDLLARPVEGLSDAERATVLSRCVLGAAPRPRALAALPGVVPARRARPRHRGEPADRGRGAGARVLVPARLGGPGAAEGARGRRGAGERR